MLSIYLHPPRRLVLRAQVDAVLGGQKSARGVPSGPSVLAAEAVREGPSPCQKFVEERAGDHMSVASELKDHYSYKMQMGFPLCLQVRQQYRRLGGEGGEGEEGGAGGGIRKPVEGDCPIW